MQPPRKKVKRATEPISFTHPHLLAEWDYEKNNRLKFNPNKLTHGSAKEVWWKCQYGHDWQAVIYSRSHGHGCPYCSNQKVCEDNCLANHDPNNLCEEWHWEKNNALTPYDVTPRSCKKVWWKCKINSSHSWQATIKNRSYGTGCLHCYKNGIK